VGNGNRLHMIEEMRFPHSLGLLYSAFTYYTGFRVNSGEYKLMGLAPYGEPVYADLIRKELLDIRDDGSFKMNMKYFNYCAGLTMTNKRFHDLFGEPARPPESPITQKHMDIARSIQLVTEEIMLKIARHAREKTGMKNLCLAGGVALNCVANGLILREKIFDDMWIQPASGDAGGALGAAMAIWHRYLDKPRTTGARDSQKATYLGPTYSDDEARRRLDSLGAVYERLSDEEIPGRVAELINSEKVIGWFQGRMEFGPRALGGRSIIGDPRSEKMQSVMNLKIKFRESFRPFAPSVMAEKVSDFFEMESESPYMLLVAPVREDKRKPIPEADKGKSGLAKLYINRSDVPAITHVDFSARVQTVTRGDNPLYYDMMAAFDKLTGCPLIINTSFNVRGEPIVCTPENAFTCFMRTNIDYLIVGNYLMDKEKQKKFEDKTDWRKEFVLD